MCQGRGVKVKHNVFRVLRPCAANCIVTFSWHFQAFYMNNFLQGARYWICSVPCIFQCLLFSIDAKKIDFVFSLRCWWWGSVEVSVVYTFRRHATRSLFSWQVTKSHFLQYFHQNLCPMSRHSRHKNGLRWRKMRQKWNVVKLFGTPSSIIPQKSPPLRPRLPPGGG